MGWECSLALSWKIWELPIFFIEYWSHVCFVHRKVESFYYTLVWKRSQQKQIDIDWWEMTFFISAISNPRANWKMWQLAMSQWLQPRRWDITPISPTRNISRIAGEWTKSAINCRCALGFLAFCPFIHQFLDSSLSEINWSDASLRSLTCRTIWLISRFSLRL